MDDDLKTKLEEIKRFRNTDNFEAAFDLLKETIQDTFNNFEKNLDIKNEVINSLFDISKDRNDFIISLFEIIEYYKYLCLEESKKKFEKYVDKFLDYIYLFLPESLRLTIDQNLIFTYIKK